MEKKNAKIINISSSETMAMKAGERTGPAPPQKISMDHPTCACCGRRPEECEAVDDRGFDGLELWQTRKELWCDKCLREEAIREMGG